MDVFGARHSHVGGKEVLWVQNKQRLVYQDHDWHSGITKEYDTIMCLSNGRKGREGLPCDSKEFKEASGLYPCNFGVKGITL
jgi:hypothetical protein